jgi:YbbR domain-containing protein
MKDLDAIEGFKRANLHVMKVMALLLAGTLWYYVVNAEPLIVEKSYPLLVIAPQGQALLNLVPREVSVKLKGPRSFLKSLDASRAPVIVDLSEHPGRKQDRFRAEIAPNAIPVPFGVEILELSPFEFEVQLEKEAKKTLPVKAQILVELPHNLKLVDTKIEPTEVVLTGPRSLMRQYARLTTRPIEIQGPEGEGSVKVDLEELDQRFSVTPKGPLTVSYQIRPNTANMTLKNVPIRFVSSSTRITSRSRKVAMDVLVVGEQKILESQVRVMAEIPEGARGVVEVPLKALLPDGVHLLKIYPESISVNVKP